MNLIFDPWIPVHTDGGSGAFRLLTYQQLLCEPGNWQVSLPRDDLELACVQLLVCMTQIMFLPEDDRILRIRLNELLPLEAFAVGTEPCREWFDLDHPTQPFMQSRGVKAAEDTPIQKLLIGLPEGNNHAFFNEAGEVRHLSGTLVAIALFNQAINCPSFGGGFKGSLRGGAPITTLVYGRDLRETVWRNILTRSRLAERQIAMPGLEQDQPTWVKPIQEKTIIHWNTIGLVRGLFWQPARVELAKSIVSAPCDVLGGPPLLGYTGFRKEKFNFTVEGVWPHPHGAMTMSLKKGVLEQKFASFTTTAPAWTQLSEFVVPKDVNDPGIKEGAIPAGPITQINELGEGSRLHLLIGGYRTNQASVLERRHEMVSLAQGWQDDKDRLSKLVEMGKDAKKALRGKLYFAVQGNKDKGLKGIGAAIHETAEKLFYARTESLIHEIFSNELTFKEWAAARLAFAQQLSRHCHDIFEELTDPYAMKPELVPIIAWARRSLNFDLAKLDGGSMTAELPDFVALKKRYDDESFPTGARAELRRVAEPEDVAFIPALYRLFPGQRPNERHQRLAYLLPCCKHSDKAKSLGAQLAEAKVAENRVLQVARTQAPLDMVQLRRLLTHIEPVVDWSEFGTMVWYWNEKAKRQLIEDFYVARYNPAKGDKK